MIQNVTIVQNQIPAPVPACQAPPSLFKTPLSLDWMSLLPTRIKPIPMDIDTSRGKDPITLTCYRCHRTGHKAPDCPLKLDIRTSSVEELEMALMVRKDMSQMDLLPVAEEVIPEDFVQDNK